MKLVNSRELNKRIVAQALGPERGYRVKHDIPGEAIVCEVPSLDIAGCIVAALRQRAAVKLAEELLAQHLSRNKVGGKKARTKKRR